VAKAHEVASCAACHRDHAGRQALLTAVPDSACTRCHADLPSHQTRTPDEPGFQNVSAFPAGHPQFRLGRGAERRPLGEARDPGKLRFNHALHLTPGLKASPDDARDWTLGDIKDKMLRARYTREQPEEARGEKDAVRLRCASCHQLDSTDAPPPGPGQAVSGRSPGDYLLPVTYEQHCKACHPLTFDPALPTVAAPHHLQPVELRRFLWGVYAEKRVRDPEPDRKGTSSRPLPGPNLSRAEAEARKKIAEQADGALAFLSQEPLRKVERLVHGGRTTCGLCHHYGRPGEQAIAPTIEPTNVPPVWFEHSTFSHRSHRAVDCLQCHAGASRSTVETDVLLPGIATCRTCHAPAATDATGKTGGVRHDCVTCHRYHNGRAPLAGLGAAARGVETRRGVRAFLNGEVPRADDANGR
jgi:hypothetical protein